jgi:peptide/nickel transport system substrate-binding protein
MKNLRSPMMLAFGALLLAACGGVESSTVSSESSASSSESSSSSQGLPTQDPNQLVVGVPSFNQNFIGGFGNNAYDVMIRNLIFSYGTFATTKAGEIVLNDTAVDDLVVTTDSVTGDKTYEFTLNADLKWSDGTAITARDYVFSILFDASKEWAAAGANTTAARELVGYAAYRAGTTSAGEPFKGVNLISSSKFAVTIASTSLPYFYETVFASFGPSPFHVLAGPTAAITQTADGAVMNAAGYERMTEIVSATGYRRLPTVVSGMYTLQSFTNGVASLTLNPYFIGDFQGKKPTIPNVVVKTINSSLDVDLVISGDIDITTGVIEGAKIQKAIASPATDLTYYARNGYGLLAMTADFGATSDYRVRQAMAHLTDRQYTTDVVLEGYGSITYSEYGLAQWMYQDSVDWVEDNLNPYEFSITEANRILDTTEYVFGSSNGTAFEPFDATKATGSYFRYRQVEGGYQQLRINHLGTENNTITDSLRERFRANLPRAGIRYSVTIADFNALLDQYYFAYELPAADRLYHIFNLAQNFGAAYDPYFSWHSNFLGTFFNANQLEDSPTNPAAPLATGEKTLDELTVAMRSLEPTQRTEYLALWREYQLRWNKLIPNVPLYSNQYYDVFDSRLQGVETSPFWTWTNAIVDMSWDL